MFWAKRIITHSIKYQEIIILWFQKTEDNCKWRNCDRFCHLGLGIAVLWRLKWCLNLNTKWVKTTVAFSLLGSSLFSVCVCGVFMCGYGCGVCIGTSTWRTQQCVYHSPSYFFEAEFLSKPVVVGCCGFRLFVCLLCEAGSQTSWNSTGVQTQAVMVMQQILLTTESSPHPQY